MDLILVDDFFISLTSKLLHIYYESEKNIYCR